MSEIKIIGGDGGRWAGSYNQAVIEGMIDPKKVSREEFMKQNKIKVLEAPDDSYAREIANSAFQVARVMKKRRS